MKTVKPTYEELVRRVKELEALVEPNKEAIHEPINLLNQEEFNSIIQLSRDGTLIGNLEGKIMAWNKAMENLTGISQSDVLNKNVWDIQYQLAPPELKTPELLIKLKAGYGEILNSDEIWTGPIFEQEIRGLDGVSRTIEDTSSVIDSTQGRIFITHLRDVSERKKEEIALKNSVAHYRSIIKASPDIIAITNLEGLVQSISQVAYKQFQFEKEDEIIGKNVLLFLVEEDRDRARQFMMKMYEGTLPGPGVYNGLRKDNTTFPLEINAEFIRDAQNQPVQMMFVGRDITERKKVELALQNSEELYRLVTVNSKDLIWVLDIETLKYRYMSPSILELTGYTVEEKMEFGFGSAIDPKSLQYLLNEFPSRLESFKKGILEYYSDEVELIHRDGHSVYTEINSTLVLNENTKKIELVGATRDITKRKIAEEKTEKIARHYQAITEKAPGGYVLLDSEAMFKFVDPSTRKIFGYDPNDQIAGSPSLYTHPDDLPMIQSNLNEVLKNSSHLPTLEYRFLSKAGNWIWVESTFTNLLHDPSVESIVINFKEITDRKKAEEEIRIKNEALSKLNADKDRFFSIIAHDLRGPINSFLTLTKMMNEEIGIMPAEEILKITLMLNSSASNLFRLLENLLQWSKIQQGSIPFNPRMIQLLPFIENCISISLEQTKIKSIETINNIPDGIEVWSDGNMLQTVVRNLFSNAIKFTPRGGKIILKATETDNDEIEISIQDTGIGMSKDLLDRIFHLNEQKKRKGTDGEPSTGLGLILCKEFIQQLHGKIRVQSEPGEGSTFTISIPTKIREN